MLKRANPQSGDLVDLEGYLGTGLFYLHHDDRMKRTVVLPTLGDRGHIIPEPGFSLVKQHGLKYFMESEITGFQISHLREIRIKDKESGDYLIVQPAAPIYLETTVDTELDDDMDEVIIDGVYLFGQMTEYFV